MFNAERGLVDYFKKMRRKPTKKIQAEIVKEDWEKVRELATHMKCPIAKIEQTLVNFAVDVALKEYDLMKDEIKSPFGRTAMPPIPTRD